MTDNQDRARRSLDEKRAVAGNKNREWAVRNLGLVRAKRRAYRRRVAGRVLCGAGTVAFVLTGGASALLLVVVAAGVVLTWSR